MLSKMFAMYIVSHGKQLFDAKIRNLVVY